MGQPLPSLAQGSAQQLLPGMCPAKPPLPPTPPESHSRMGVGGLSKQDRAPQDGVNTMGGGWQQRARSCPHSHLIPPPH